MPKSTTAKKASPKATAPKSKSAKRPLADIAASTTKKVNAGGRDLKAVLKNNKDKVARVPHNAERHLSLDGKTVEEALATRLVDARDIKYDISKGFMLIS